MFKEMAVCIAILISIFTLDFKTQNYTEKIVQQTTSKLQNLREEILKGDKQDEEILNNMEEIYDQWMEFHNKLAFYIEHDELEKVETDMVSLRGNIEVKEYDMAISELDKSVFVLQHIEDKYKFNLENVF